MQVWPQTYTPLVGAEQVKYMLDRFYSPEALARQMTEQGHHFVVSHADGRPVAFASWGQLEPGICKLHKLYVGTLVQGKGYGRLLVDRVAMDTQASGAHSLRLNVNIHNHAAMAFYERYGFRRVYDEDIDIGSGFFMNDHVYEVALGG